MPVAFIAGTIIGFVVGGVMGVTIMILCMAIKDEKE